MHNELTILIKETQKEQDYLKSEIERSVSESDFLSAYQFQAAFELTVKKISILNNLLNPHFYEIAQLERNIQNDLNSIGENKYSETVINFLSDRLAEAENALKNLKNSKSRFSIDGEALIVGLESLMAGKIKVLEFLFVERFNAKLVICRSETDLKIQLTYDVEFTHHYNLGEKEFGQLRQIGFNMEEEPVEMVVKSADVLNIPVVIKIVARICFDVFGLYGNKSGNIVYKT